MEPLPGITALCALFDRATGARLEAAERFVAALPGLFSDSIVGCDVGWQHRIDAIAVVMRFAEKRFSSVSKQRLDFWCGRAGVRVTALDALASVQREAFFANFDRCDASVKGVPPDRLAGDVFALFTKAGAPEDRRRPLTSPVLSMDVGGPGWEGVRYLVDDLKLVVPGLLGPPVGDELVLMLRIPELESPIECRARVEASTGEESSGAGAFVLALFEPPEELTAALEREAAERIAPNPPGGQRRVHPRFAVKAPVLVTPYDPDKTGSTPLNANIGEPFSDVDKRGAFESVPDYVENLSQSGAFVRKTDSPPPGTRVTLSMKVPGGGEVQVPAAVVNSNEKGMGVKFEPDEAGKQQLAATIANLAARPRRALVVDDDALVCRMVKDSLELRGFEVITANDGASGLSLLSEELLALDLLITDVRMPNMDGETLVHMIREAGGESDLAIVVMAGTIQDGLDKRLQHAGADAVLDKALGPQLIAQAADAVVERKRGGQH